MGTNPKKAIVADHVGQALQNWHKDAQKRVKATKKLGKSELTPRANSLGEDQELQDFMDNKSLRLDHTGTTEANEDELVPWNVKQGDSPSKIDTIVTEDGSVYRYKDIYPTPPSTKFCFSSIKLYTIQILIDFDM